MTTTPSVRMNILSLHNAIVDLRSKLSTGRTITAVDESLALAVAILREFFSEAWCNKCVMPESAKPNFLRIDESDQTRLDLTALRIIDLAEIVYNLQDVPGFDDCIAKMRNGDIEGTYAELDLGRMLYLNQVRFRYVVPQQVKGHDYDVEVEYPDGLIACAEAKCSIDRTELSAKTIRNKLDCARRQLPRDRLGIVFVKMPSRWMDSDEFLNITVGAAEDFLRGTKRVDSVKFYVATNSIEGDTSNRSTLTRKYRTPITISDWGETGISFDAGTSDRNIMGCRLTGSVYCFSPMARKWSNTNERRDMRGNNQNLSKLLDTAFLPYNRSPACRVAHAGYLKPNRLYASEGVWSLTVIAVSQISTRMPE